MGRVVVTGVNGFVGPHLVNELKALDLLVIGIGHGDANPGLKAALDQYFSIDLTDQEAVKNILDFNGIEAVIHLAGLSSQGMSFEQPQRFISANSAMLINLFETAIGQKQTPRFVVVSSGAVYDSEQTMPITEEGSIAHKSPYAISKLLNENLCDYYRARGFECIVARPFNHTGPGQGPGFILPDLVTQIQDAAETGKSVRVGNLKTRRDYSDVRDIVKAYALLATQEELGHSLYNLCSGKSRSGEEMFDAIVAAMGIEKPQVEVDQSKIRPNDPPEIYGSHERLSNDTGWETTISFETTVRDFLDTHGEE